MAKIDGTADADILNGTEFADEIYGLGGDDQIQGSGDADLIDGGEGNDWLQGGHGNDTLKGGTGNDIIKDGTGGGAFYGGDGADFIYLMYQYQIEDSLLVDGGNDNDTIIVGAPYPGEVTILGGAGSDRIDLNFAADQITITLGTQRDILSFGNSLRDEQGQTNYLTSVVLITDFSTGNSGDVFDPSYFWGTSLVGWDQTVNPFGAGYARLEASGSSTLFQVDLDGSGSAYGYQTFLTLQNTAKSAFAAANFGGYDPAGSNVAGLEIVGNSGHEEFVGTLGKDSIDGAGGNDYIQGGGGSDTLEGGDGSDALYGEVGHDLLLGEGGNDFLIGGVGDDELRGGDGDDSISGDQGNDLIEGGAGKDSLSGGVGDDIITGGDGDDYLHDPGGSNRLDGGAGNDMIAIYSMYAGEKQNVLGGVGDDVVRIVAANSKSVLVDTGLGDDRVEVNGDGGAGVLVTLGAGFDTLAFIGTHGGHAGGGVTVRDFQVGPLGEKVDWAAFLSKSLIGWNGTNNPFASGYARLVQSGPSALLQVDVDGDDFRYGFQTVATFDNVLATDFTAENIGFDLLRVLDGTAASNRIVGTGESERINGLAGNDVLVGGGGDDLLMGGDGNDVLKGGTGTDRLYGGIGHDEYEVDHAGDRIFELRGEGVDTVRSLVSFELPDHVENLILGAGAVEGRGNDLANAITGN
ncbi:MAG TPA: calcium-binding protein, partial [Allosphingosinicella sp.]|nr:calcium-binding protein [Allosphingosinicella sp.]